MENYQTLVPFAGDESSKLAGARYLVRAHAAIHETEWIFRFRVDARTPDALAELVLPEVSPAGERRDGLWQSTCFEVFAAMPDSTAYFEWNGASNGDWNLYRFEDYRRGMQPVEVRAQGPRFREIERDTQRWEGEWRVPLSLLPSSSAIGLTAVTDTLSAGRSSVAYWALRHCAPQADFHRRESFVFSPVFSSVSSSLR